MATLYESYLASTSNLTIFGINWEAQTFTPVDAHKITSVKLKLSRYADFTALTTVSIRATDGGGQPTGGDLCFGTIAAAGITTDMGNAAWYEITQGDGTNLDADTKYAIVVRAPDADSSNRLRSRYHSSGAYAGGNQERSSNSGVDWTALVARDLPFEDWGEPPIDPPTVTTQAVTDIGFD